ncbi:conserved hypothetical protein [Tenacibaculum sp. 190524A05c]|uniref:hypothetical protein n=1 Tax=Tenacibaculum platacis TaxID=3137852 RepID=UPI0031FA954C
MIEQKENPIGIDYEIQKFQNYLNKKLVEWNLQGFGRAELIDNKLLLYHKKNDYKNAFTLNPKFNGRFFFLDSNQSVFNNRELKTFVELIFILNIGKIKPNFSSRADEEVRIELLKFINNKVKREVSILKGQEVVKDYKNDLVNMQPYHFLKFSFELKYNNNVNTF